MEHTNPDDGDEPTGDGTGVDAEPTDDEAADVGAEADAGTDDADGSAEPAGDGDEEAEPDLPADWMDPADDDILEAMRDEDVFTPDHIDELKICRGPYAATRCRQLTKYGLLEKLAIGMYDITDRGERYLDGDLDPSELEPEE